MMGKRTCNALARTGMQPIWPSQHQLGQGATGESTRCTFLEQAWGKRFPQCSSQFRGLERVDELNLRGCGPAQPCHFVERRQES
jgi:hypothetical protein